MSRIFENSIPKLNGSDRIKNIKNKEIYTAVKNSVENSEMSHEKYTFDVQGCLRSSPNYEAYLSLVRGWGQCITANDISGVINEQEKPGGKALGTFIDKTASWAQNYSELPLTNFTVVTDKKSNAVAVSAIENKINEDLSGIELNHPLNGVGNSGLLTGMSVGQKYTALNPIYSTSIKVDPNNVLYYKKEFDETQKEPWKDLVATQKSNIGYHNNLRRIAQMTDYQFTFPRKFNIKYSKTS